MVSAIRRTVWNGASELAEIQMPAADSTPADTVENDTLAIQRHRDGTPFHELYDANRLYGRVLYVPGPVTDEPVFITRVNYADASDVTGGAETYGVYAPFSIIPLWSATGRVDRAVLGGTARPGADPDSLCVGTSSRCAEVAFDRGLFPYARSGSDPGSWQGTVLVDKPDATGTYYRRNRSYDPNTGRFTQEDPIGLAGGLNLYGFAAGDPVSYQDPFGLCPKSAGGDGKTDTYDDCPKGTSGYDAHQAQIGKGGLANDVAGAYHSCKESGPCKAVAGVGAAIAGGWLVEGAATIGGALFGGAEDAAGFQLTKTVADHAASRPFVNSQLLVREIMNAAEGVPDPQGVAGALRWDVPGAFNKSEGIWELVVHMDTKTILHFMFQSLK
jgi:RHS repeat-associated protein